MLQTNMMNICRTFISLNTLKCHSLIVYKIISFFYLNFIYFPCYIDVVNMLGRSHVLLQKNLMNISLSQVIEM